MPAITYSGDIPSSCPSCGASSVVAQNDMDRKFQIPAVRFSTEVEMEQSRLADQTESSQKSFPERVKGLSGYTISDNEYHMALMLLFYFRSASEEFTAKHLDDLLHGKNSYFESRIAET